MKFLKKWIIVILSVQALWYWRACQSRVSVELWLRELDYEDTCNSCTVTFCLQERNQSSDGCPFGMISFIGDREGQFDDGSVIGTKNSSDVSNPLMFFIDLVRFDIRATVSLESTVIFMRTRRVNVEGDLNAMRRVLALTNGTGAVTMMAYSYRVLCDRMYYGLDCSRYCEDTDDETGHFTCDGEGNPVCLPGYNHSSTNDSRCTRCIENCTATTMTSTEGIISNEALPSGATAAIVICVLFVLTVVVVGGIAALLLAMFRPWAADSAVNEARSRSTSKALNNPIYEDETFTDGRNTSRSGANITSDGAADLRDQPFNESNRLEESSPLYASESQMDRSVFVDNKSLVGVLDLQPTASNPPQPQPNVVVDAKEGIASYNVGAQ